MSTRKSASSLLPGTKPTTSSHRSVLQGTKNFVWNREEVSSNLPYHNHNYEIPFNKPPNEVNFMGGLGSKKPNFRSKLHPQRFSTVQKLMRMRTSNRILETLTEDLRNVNLCRHRGDQRRKAKNVTEFIRKMTDELQTAGNIEHSTPSDQSDVLRCTVRKKLTNDDYREMIKRLDKILLEDDRPSAGQNVSFRDWAMRERYNFQNRSNIEMMKRERETLESELCSSVDTRSHEYISNEGRRVTKVRRSTKIPHVEGHMYGPFTRLPVEDPLLENETKFGIPLSLLVRSYREMDTKKEGERNLIDTRLSHMRIPLCPKSSDSSEDEDQMEEVKILSFLRTPYFPIPTIKRQKKRRKDRLRSRWLQKNRLKRITMLLYDRSLENMRAGRRKKGKHGDVGASSSRASSSGRSRTELKVSGTKKPADVPVVSEKRQRYYRFIEDKSQQYRRMYDESLQQRMTSFQDFKASETASDDNRSETSRKKAKLQGLRLEEPKPAAEKLELTFPPNRFKSLSKNDTRKGAFYIDPEFYDKMRDFKRYKQRSKYYTSLMRSRPDVRQRLQVNAPEFEEEQLGAATKYYSRLATEWDNYYIHELRYRPRVRKFCPKTDILNMRDQRRKVFLQYFIEENLLQRRARQSLERQYANWIKNFCKRIHPLFKVWKEEAYSKLVAATDQEKEATQESVRLRALLQNRQNRMDSITERILLLEQRWTKVMQIRNYYYLLMDSQWRLENDFFHRAPDGSLYTVSESIKNCKSIFIRTEGSNIGTEIASFYLEKTFPELERLPGCVPDVGLLQRGLTQLNLRTIDLINKYNQKLMVFSKIDYHYKEVLEQFPRYFTNHHDLLNLYGAKMESIQSKNDKLRTEFYDLLGEPLKVSVYNKIMRITTSAVGQLYLFVRKLQHRQVEIVEISAKDKLSAIHQHIMDLLSELDLLPLDVLKEAEKEARKNRKTLFKEANEAYKRKMVLDLLRKQLRFHVRK
ncbi:uncharacterized protein LOC126565806 [Anopheles maculipalpis]|uniref:uncharacterized protein LOC126565806 n=1 Tax=Anopheles maculipalpis TaxID=1496333 RepID=UPI002158E0DA|nr:uncharacterized protein LOC126565806 [Anopheles maculipalpis]